MLHVAALKSMLHKKLPVSEHSVYFGCAYDTTYYTYTHVV